MRVDTFVLFRYESRTAANNFSLAASLTDDSAKNNIDNKKSILILAPKKITTWQIGQKTTELVQHFGQLYST